jgi:hypothetical protein
VLTANKTLVQAKGIKKLELQLYDPNQKTGECSLALTNKSHLGMSHQLMDKSIQQDLQLEVIAFKIKLLRDN